MTIDKILANATAEAVKSLYGADFPAEKITPQTTRKEFEGNLTIMVFPFLKASSKAPEATAAEIGDYLVEHCSAVEKYNVVKGFLNITVSAAFWADVLARIANTPDFGFVKSDDNSPLVMIEYSSPNTNKPLHLGHVRNNLLGYSLARILQACGYRVVKTNIVNDRGIHICKSMLAWQKWGHGATPQSTGKKGDHLIGDYYVLFDKHYRSEIADLMAQGLSEDEAKQQAPLMLEAREMLRRWEAGDPEVRALWEMMNQWVYDGFDETYRRLGVDFDKIYYESQTYLEGKAKVLEGLEKGLFYKKDDGSVWADLTDEGLDHKILLRSDGTSVYMTQDIGTAKLRYQDYPIDRMVYVVGNEQNYHFQVLSILLDRLGFKWGKDLIHFSYGMVELPEGKMKSREGTVVDADDLMDKMVATARNMCDERNALADLPADERERVLTIIGMGALKYFLLKIDPRKNMVFDPKESIDFNGNTGPFLQYTYARIQSMLRRAGDQPATVTVKPNDKEVSIIQLLADFPTVVADAGKNFSPALVANYAYELAKSFNQYYHDYDILREPDADTRAMRLTLARAVADVLRNATSLLGMEMPQRM